MALRMGALYDALKTAHGIDEAAAKAAAEEVAAYDARMAAIAADLLLLKWMMGTVIALLLLVIGIGLTTLSRLTLP